MRVKRNRENSPRPIQYDASKTPVERKPKKPGGPGQYKFNRTIVPKKTSAAKASKHTKPLYNQTPKILAFLFPAIPVEHPLRFIPQKTSPDFYYDSLQHPLQIQHLPTPAAFRCVSLEHSLGL